MGFMRSRLGSGKRRRWRVSHGFSMVRALRRSASGRRWSRDSTGRSARSRLKMTGLKKSSDSERRDTAGLDCAWRRFESAATMRDSGSLPLPSLLPSGADLSRGPVADEPDRRGVHAAPVLRESEDGYFSRDTGTHGQSEEDPEAHAADGHPGDLSGSEHQPAPIGACGVSVSPERSSDYEAPPGLERGHHLYPADSGFCLSGGDSGLVFPVRAVLEALEQPGDGLLYGGPRRGPATGNSRDLQHGSGMPVHQPGLHCALAGAGHPNQHGLTWSCLRQHFYGEALEDCQIRGRVSSRLSNDDRISTGTGEIFSVLQRREVPSIAWIPDALSGPLWRQKRPSVRQRLNRASQVGLQSTISVTHGLEQGAFSPGGRTDLKKEKRSKKERRIRKGESLSSSQGALALPLIRKNKQLLLKKWSRQWGPPQGVATPTNRSYHSPTGSPKTTSLLRAVKRSSPGPYCSTSRMG